MQKLANAQKVAMQAMKREKTKKADWEKVKVHHEMECDDCRPGCIIGGKCQQDAQFNPDTCSQRSGLFCYDECTATAGNEASQHYPCACGTEMCHQFQLCDAHSNKCK